MGFKYRNLKLETSVTVMFEGGTLASMFRPKPHFEILGDYLYVSEPDALRRYHLKQKSSGKSVFAGQGRVCAERGRR